MAASHVAEHPAADLRAEVDHRVQPRDLLRVEAKVGVEIAADVVRAHRFEPDHHLGPLTAHEAHGVGGWSAWRRGFARDPPGKPGANGICGRLPMLDREPESWG